jgi:hypothetical protein
MSKQETEFLDRVHQLEFDFAKVSAENKLLKQILEQLLKIELNPKLRF